MFGLKPVPSPKPSGTRYLGGKIYPTGEGVLYPLHRKKDGEDGVLSDVRSEYRDQKDFWEENSRLFGVQSASAKLLAVAAIDSHLQKGGVLRTGGPIDSSSAAISHTPRNRKGSKGITTHAKRVLRFSAATIEKRAGNPSNLSFLTLTLPPMSKESWKGVLEGWGDIVRTFNQWLSRQLVKRGMPGHLVGCTEVQPERSRRTGEPALHLHIVFQGRKRGRGWAVTPIQCRKAWGRALQGKVSECLTLESTEHLVQVKKSASKYLAKYLSKSGSEWESNVLPEYRELHPTSWSFTPNELKRLYHASTWSGDEAVAILTLCVNNKQYRHGSVIEMPIYALPNGQWVKVVLVKLERAFARSLDERWCA